jgi:hypothetical protein
MSAEASWKPETFIEDHALNYACLKPAELPIIMSLLDGGSKYTLKRNMHPSYIAVRDNLVVLGHADDQVAKEIAKLNLRTRFQRVGWTRSGLECMTQEDNREPEYLKASSYEVDNVGSFVSTLLRTDSGDEVMVEPVLEDGAVTTVLRVMPMLRIMTLVVLALDRLGLRQISLNTANDFYAIFSAGMLVVIEEGMLDDEPARDQLLDKLNGSGISLLTKMMSTIATSMEVKVL